MAAKIPTTAELTEQNLTGFESKLNQTAPLLDKAFLRVLAFIQAASSTGLYKFAIERLRQNLVLTATGNDLKNIGLQYGVVYKNDVAAELIITVPATTGSLINATTAFIGNSNGIRYTANATYSESGNIITATITSQTLGVAGNLVDGETLTIESQVAGVQSTATVIETTVTGTDPEDQEVYRQRVLNEIRTVGGGGNGVDYRTWAEKTPGVRRAYPYAGRPEYAGESLPGERTVYIEAQEAIDPDGVAPQSLLDTAREYIDTNQDTGQVQTPLGLPNNSYENGGTLWVESVTVTPMYVEIRNLTVDPDFESQMKNEIESEVINYFRNAVPFVDGVDSEVDRVDSLSSITLSTVVQSVMGRYGAFAASVLFGTSIGVYLTYYTLGQGEKAKLEQIQYVTV